MAELITYTTSIPVCCRHETQTRDRGVESATKRGINVPACSGECTRYGMSCPRIKVKTSRSAKQAFAAPGASTWEHPVYFYVPGTLTSNQAEPQHEATHTHTHTTNLVCIPRREPLPTSFHRTYEQHMGGRKYTAKWSPTSPAATPSTHTHKCCHPCVNDKTLL